ncbi:MAG: hypothetical protein ACRDL5_08055 [Solirubrobacteraceae bacterium]
MTEIAHACRYDRRMGYKLLGFVVWRGARWYLRRRVRAARGRIAAAVVGLAVIAGLVAAGTARRGSADTR